MEISVKPIGIVESDRTDFENDCWGGEESTIVLSAEFPEEALKGIEEFSHVEVVFLFDRVDPANVHMGSRHPRDNPKWPSVGVFAQRVKNRPNRIGTTICRIVGADGTRLRVNELDVISGTPVLDIKPVMTEFLPREEIRQPSWSHELMRYYWK